MYPFLKAGVLEAMSKALLLCCPWTSQLRPILSEVLQHYLSIVLTVLKAKNAPDLAAQTFNLGLLSGLTTMADDLSFLDNGCLDALQLFFKWMLTPFLVHRCVVLAAIKAVKEIPGSRMSLLRIGPFKDEWNLFYDTLVERACFNAIYESMLKPELSTCNHVSRLYSP